MWWSIQNVLSLHVFMQNRVISAVPGCIWMPVCEASSRALAPCSSIPCETAHYSTSRQGSLFSANRLAAVFKNESCKRHFRKADGTMSGLGPETGLKEKKNIG